MNEESDGKWSTLLEQVRALRVEVEGDCVRLDRAGVPPDLWSLLGEVEVLGASDDGVRATIEEMLPGQYAQDLQTRVGRVREQLDAWLQACEPSAEEAAFIAFLRLLAEAEAGVLATGANPDEQSAGFSQEILNGAFDRVRQKMSRRGPRN